MRWKEAWRIIASRFPPIQLFERVSSDPAVWEALTVLEQLTNPRIRDEIGEISFVPPERRVSGPNATWVMAPFTHVNRIGSRFSDGTYGVYYAANDLVTAIAETSYHFARFATDANDPPRREDMRVLLGAVDHELHDIATLPSPALGEIMDKHSYLESRKLALHYRSVGSDGFTYPSVRNNGGQCIAAFWPDVVKLPVQERHLKYEWDGNTFTRYFDYKEQQWLVLPNAAEKSGARE